MLLIIFYQKEYHFYDTNYTPRTDQYYIMTIASKTTLINWKRSTRELQGWWRNYKTSHKGLKVLSIFRLEKNTSMARCHCKCRETKTQGATYRGTHGAFRGTIPQDPLTEEQDCQGSPHNRGERKGGKRSHDIKGSQDQSWRKRCRSSHHTIWEAESRTIKNFPKLPQFTSYEWLSWTLCHNHREECRVSEETPAGCSISTLLSTTATLCLQLYC